jgi:signal transduction histidine kinase
MEALVRRISGEIQTSVPERRIEHTMLGDLKGVWDGERLCQVMTNLVGNAVHHGTANEPVQVLVDGRCDDVLVVEVANGGAIAPELLPDLFDPFRGRASAGGRQQGLGLGLFIAQQIVLAHGGRINVLSQDGRTRFRVELPRVAPGAAADRSV